MNHATQTAVINAPLALIRDALLTAPQLPEWNRAFLNVNGAARATSGAVYELEAIRGMRGTLTYTEVQERVIVFSWRVPMLTELAAWELYEQGQEQTTVTHTVERKGTLATAIAHTLGALPGLRLKRLAERTASMAPEGVRKPNQRRQI